MSIIKGLGKQPKQKLVIGQQQRKMLPSRNFLIKNENCIPQLQIKPQKLINLCQNQQFEPVNELKPFSQKHERVLSEITEPLKQNKTTFKSISNLEQLPNLKLRRSTSLVPLGCLFSKNNIPTKNFRGRTDKNFLEVEAITEEILQTLKETFQLHSNSTGILIKQEHFKSIFLNLFQLISDNSSSQVGITLEKSSSSLNRSLSKIKGLVKKDKVSRLKYQSNFLSIKFDPFENKTQSQSLKQKVQQLRSQELKTKSEIQSRKNCLQQIQERIKVNQEAEFYLNEKCRRKKLQLQKIQKIIKEKQAFLQNIDQKNQKIFSFVEQQKQQRAIHSLSETYKEIEGQMYNYAICLLNNAKAIQFIPQVKDLIGFQERLYEVIQSNTSFQAGQKEFEGVIKHINSKLQMTVRSLIIQFQKENAEMIKVADFKTQCTKKFTKMMEKWIQSWEMKQRFLVNLRSEFAAESEEINTLFNELKQMLKRHTYAQNLKLKVEALKKYWERIELNYKYGNSFY